MVESRADRRAGRRERVLVIFGEAHVEAALDLLELTELAWHDCYEAVSPSEAVIDDILLCSRGDLDGLIRAARVAVTDTRDLSLWAQAERTRDSR
ncbi:MAG TPA: hypothetical protein VFA83_12715 [Acidimicrobiales bacterium]|nr:hypothetical protein [Acidimicrobiales bacterium]